MRLCELREMEVINGCTCKRLGCVEDLEIDCAEDVWMPSLYRFRGKSVDYGERKRNM